MPALTQRRGRGPNFWNSDAFLRLRSILPHGLHPSFEWVSYGSPIGGGEGPGVPATTRSECASLIRSPASPKWLFRLPRWSLCDGAGFRPTSEFGLRHEVGYHHAFKGPDSKQIRLFLRALVLNRTMFPGKHRRDGRAVDSTLNHDTEPAAVSEIVE